VHDVVLLLGLATSGDVLGEGGQTNWCFSKYALPSLRNVRMRPRRALSVSVSSAS
jgi:hypothetical protein